jgi:hypothetical protein
MHMFKPLLIFNVLLTVQRSISVIIGPIRCTVYFQFISINSLYMFRALFCSSSGGTVCTTTGIFCAYYVGWQLVRSESCWSYYTALWIFNTGYGTFLSLSSKLPRRMVCRATHLTVYMVSWNRRHTFVSYCLHNLSSFKKLTFVVIIINSRSQQIIMCHS